MESAASAVVIIVAAQKQQNNNDPAAVTVSAHIASVIASVSVAEAQKDDDPENRGAGIVSEEIRSP